MQSYHWHDKKLFFIFTSAEEISGPFLQFEKKSKLSFLCRLDGVTLGDEIWRTEAQSKFALQLLLRPWDYPGSTALNEQLTKEQMGCHSLIKRNPFL